MVNLYVDEPVMVEAVRRGAHRDIIGGLWDEIGPLQFAHLLATGLRPDHRVLDIGCGCLRLGRLLVDYLQPGGYFGTDVSPSLLDAGYTQELTDSGRARLPRGNLVQDGDFVFPFEPGAQFDRMIAQSVFTHLTLNSLRRCLVNARERLAPGGRLLFTYFDSPPEHRVTLPLVHDHPPHAPFETYDDRDPFHYTEADIRYVAAATGWRVGSLGRWGHPKGQSMVALRLDD